MQLIEEQERSSRARTRLCEADGCRATTRGYKPYCPDHVELNPYVQRLAEQLQESADGA